jgi:hypothetical protein
MSLQEVSTLIGTTSFSADPSTGTGTGTGSTAGLAGTSAFGALVFGALVFGALLAIIHITMTSFYIHFNPN